MSERKPGPRRKNDRSEVPVSFLPEGNPPARWGYILSLVGLVPGLGVILGIPAVVLGWRGRVAARRDESHRGLGHSYFASIAGCVEFVSHTAGAVVLFQAYRPIV